MNHSASLSVAVKSTLGADADPYRELADRMAMAFDVQYGNGTGLGQSNNRFYKTYTIAPSTDLDLDLAGGLTNELGGVLAPTKLKMYFFGAPEDNTASLVISRPAANGVPILSAAAAAFPSLTPGGLIAFADPSATAIAITAGTGDLIKIANASLAAQKVIVCLFLITP